MVPVVTTDPVGPLAAKFARPANQRAFPFTGQSLVMQIRFSHAKQAQEPYWVEGLEGL
jgi:hypothetical protein